MDTAQEQRKKKVGSEVTGAAGGSRSVFDQLGNSGLLAQVEGRKVDEQQPSLLSAAADEQIAAPVVEAPVVEREEEAAPKIVAPPDAEAQNKTATTDGAKSAAPVVIAPVAPTVASPAGTAKDATAKDATAKGAPAVLAPVVAADPAKAPAAATPSPDQAVQAVQAAEEIAKVAPAVVPAVAPVVAPVATAAEGAAAIGKEKEEKETAKIVAPPAEEAPTKTAGAAAAVATALGPVVAPVVAPAAAKAPPEATKPAVDALAAQEAHKAEQLSAGELDRVAAEEQQQAEIAADLTVQEDPAKAAAIAKATGIDPVLITDPKDLGSSELAKQKALGAEGEAALGRAMDAAAASLGGGALDTAARDLVRQQVQEQLEVSDIVEARRDGKLDALVEGALRTNALRSRDEVIFLLQQVAQDERALQEMLAGGDPGSIAIGLIESMAVSLVELEDLYALAAYDHGDILKKVVLDDDALNVKRFLSPVALKMGGFSSVLYQIVCDELAIHPLPVDPSANGELDTAASAPSFEKNLLQIVTDLRLYRTTA